MSNPPVTEPIDPGPLAGIRRLREAITAKSAQLLALRVDANGRPLPDDVPDPATDLIGRLDATDTP